MGCNVLQCAEVCCSVLPNITSQCVAECGVLQCDAVCCSVLQNIASRLKEVSIESCAILDP